MIDLRAFIISECKKNPHLADKAKQLADFILRQPGMNTESGVKAFLDGYLSPRGGE